MVGDVYMLIQLGWVVWGSTKFLILDPAGFGHAPFRLDARHSQADLQGLSLQTLLLLEAGTLRPLGQGTRNLAVGRYPEVVRTRCLGILVSKSGASDLGPGT